MRSRRHRSTSILLGVLAAAALGLLVYATVHRGRLWQAGVRARVRRGPVTQAIMPLNPADLDLGMPGQNTELRLEEALRETFPASDAIATHIE